MDHSREPVEATVAGGQAAQSNEPTLMYFHKRNKNEFANRNIFKHPKVRSSSELLSKKLLESQHFLNRLQKFDQLKKNDIRTKIDPKSHKFAKDSMTVDDSANHL